MKQGYRDKSEWKECSVPGEDHWEGGPPPQQFTWVRLRKTRGTFFWDSIKKAENAIQPRWSFQRALCFLLWALDLPFLHQEVLSTFLSFSWLVLVINAFASSVCPLLGRQATNHGSPSPPALHSHFSLSYSKPILWRRGSSPPYFMMFISGG